MSVVPDEIATAVHRAATVPAAREHDLDGLRRRAGDRRRRHQTVLAAGAAAALAAITAVGVPQLVGPTAAPPGTHKPQPGSRSPPRRRRRISGWFSLIPVRRSASETAP
jgi:hypothetical protein